MTPIRSLLATIGQDPRPSVCERHAFAGLTDTQRVALQSQGRPVYRGKVRDVVTFGDQLLIVHSDRLTAFDRLIGLVPYKGSILTAISAYWLQEAEAVVPTHYLGFPHERVLRVRRTEPIKVEVVVRGYLAGALQRAYAEGARNFCGVTLADGLIPYGKLPQPILTPTTKAAAFEHDENTTAAELIRRGTVSASQWRQIEDMSLALFKHGTAKLAAHGWLLVDTKYEFGLDPEGKLRLIDEVHTPDSSRFWLAESYAERLKHGEAPVMLDKENVRRYLINAGFQGHGQVPLVPTKQLLSLADVYLQVAESLTGQILMSHGPETTLDWSRLAPSS